MVFAADKHQLCAYQPLSPANSLSGGFKGRAELVASALLGEVHQLLLAVSYRCSRCKPCPLLPNWSHLLPSGEKEGVGA